ncbi:hypothetical protein C6501_11725 [Candidatus Poribacteria bacterium]|nr:MAG: hypothetical protein C6501_11725 [Candidatus Poribacteria bacterium]
MFLFFSSPTFAAFNDIGIGARPLGLGGAFVALADDSNAANYNAAGLAYIEEIQIGATYAQRFNGRITYNTIGGIVPLGRVGTLGANIGILTEDSDIYQEQTLRFSYGNTIFKQFGVGVNLKLLGINFDAENEFVTENPYFTQTSSSALSFDVGLIAKPFNSLNIGISVENLLPANMSISEANTDSVPQNIRVGIVYRLKSIAAMSAQGAAISNLLKSTLGTVEVLSRSGEIYTRAGVEIWVNKAIAIRGGYGMNSGGNSATIFSLGGSAKIPISSTSLQLDYGFQLLTGDLQDNTTQRFSVNLLF